MNAGPVDFPPTADAADRALLARAAAETRWPNWRELDADTLGEIAGAAGLDFATALLYDRLARSSEHGPAIHRAWASALQVDGDLRAPSGAAKPPEIPGAVPAQSNGARRSPSTSEGQTPIAIVPGAFYREYPDTGADGRALLASATSAGQRVEIVPVRSFGSVAENAEILCRWLEQQPPDAGLVLVALSKGAADVAAALTRRDEAPEAFGHGRVRAWVNVSGLLGGTALVNYLRVRPWAMAWVRTFLWWHGYRPETFHELACGHPAVALPPATTVGLPTFHVVGFPLARHLSTHRARRGYRRLSPLGPNDGGGILLGDVTRWPGTILPVWGADHYLAGVDVPGLIQAAKAEGGRRKAEE